MRKISNNGITLISLVITIVIMLILAGVSLTIIFNSGLIDKSKKAKEDTLKAQEDENKSFAEYEAAIDSVGGQGGAGQIGTSVNKTDIPVEVTYKGTSAMTLKADASGIQDTIQKYIFIVGDTVKEDTNNEATIDKLNEDTTYDVTVIATSNNSKQYITNMKVKTEPKVYLYNNGDSCSSITGGWEATNKISPQDSGSISQRVVDTTFNSDNISLFMIPQSVSLYGGSLLQKNELDFSKYSKIGIEYTASIGKASSATIIRLKYLAGEGYDSIPGDALIYFTTSKASKTKVTYDIKDIRDNMKKIGVYLQAHGNDGNAQINVYKIWLEK